MGLFSGIKSTYKKSEAAVVVQNLLEHQARVGLFDLDPAKAANIFIELVWESKPDIFDGKFGQRPHKIVVAASALANATQLFDSGDLNGNAVVISLGNILSELETNGRLYPLNSLDHQLLEGAVTVFSEIAKEFEDSPLSKYLATRFFHAIPTVTGVRGRKYSITMNLILNEIDELLGNEVGLTWEEWLTEFKEEAGVINPQLKPDEKGSSLIDFMEHEPLQRAHRDGVQPRPLAADFAAQFDITTFGQ